MRSPSRGAFAGALPFSRWLQSRARASAGEIRSGRGTGLRGPGQTAPTLSAAEMLACLYRGVLDRCPDEPGFRQYCAGVHEGLPWEEVVRSFVESQEATLIHLRTVREGLWDARPTQGGRPLLFLHVMKTGGTTISDALRRLLRPELCLTGLYLDHLVGLPSYVVEKLALIAGHLPFEAVELLPGDVTICTVVRDPVERTLSHWAHLNRDPATSSPPLGDADHYQRHAGGGLTLEEFVESPHWQQLWCNHQSRQLVRRAGVAGAWESFSPRQRLEAAGIACPPGFPHPLQMFFECSPPIGPERDLERVALERLESVELLGLTEQLDLFFEKVAAFLGKSPAPALPRLNAAPDRPRQAEVPTRLLARIREGNAADLALHDKARRLTSS